MLHSVLLTAGWLLPFLVLLLFIIKGRFYNPAVFTPPAAEISVLPVPASLGGWILEGGVSLPADRMFEKINGKADYYLQYGAVELCSGEWVINGQRWDMYLYRFETEQGARGAYNGEKPSNGKSIEGAEGYTVPGQAAMAVGTCYLQLGAQVPEADPDPAVELARALSPHLGGAEKEETAQLDLLALAADNLIGNAEGFLPENAFGFSSLNQVRTVEVALGDVGAVWFVTSGDAALVPSYAEELAMYGGEDLFTEDGTSGGSMFGSWSIVGPADGQVWGVQNAPSKDALMLHWNTLQKRLEAGTP